MFERIRAYMSQRLGPFPLWAWLTILIVLVTGFLLWRKNRTVDSDTSSTYDGPGLAPQLGDPPFITDPQVGGGRTEPGWTGPNSSLPSWMDPIDFGNGSPGGGFDPPLSSIPPLTVPQLPTIPPLTRTTRRLPKRDDERLTTAQIAIARERVGNKVLEAQQQAEQAKTWIQEKVITPPTPSTPAQKAMIPPKPNTVKKLPAKTGGVGLNRPQSSGRLT